MAVEFALVMLPLLLLVFGIIGFGVVFAQQLSLDNAARQGARFGVVADRTCTDITNQTQDAAGTLAMSPDDVSVVVTDDAGTTLCSGPSATVPCKDSDPGESIHISASFTSELVVPLVVADPSFDLDGTGVFRCEFS